MGGAFIADHQVSLDTGEVEYQGFVDLDAFLWQPGREQLRALGDDGHEG